MRPIIGCRFKFIRSPASITTLSLGRQTLSLAALFWLSLLFNESITLINFYVSILIVMASQQYIHFCSICVSCLPNDNVVIDAGDRINLNRQPIIGRIGLQVHKIRNFESHRTKWSSFRRLTWHVLYDTLDIELFFSEYCACMNDYRKIVGGFIHKSPWSTSHWEKSARQHVIDCNIRQ